MRALCTPTRREACSALTTSAMVRFCGCRRAETLPPRKLLLFAVRPGEAIHNVRESEARKSAEVEALERGIRNGSTELLAAKEEDRKSVV